MQTTQWYLSSKTQTVKQFCMQSNSLWSSLERKVLNWIESSRTTDYIISRSKRALFFLSLSSCLSMCCWLKFGFFKVKTRVCGSLGVFVFWGMSFNRWDVTCIYSAERNIRRRHWSEEKKNANKNGTSDYYALRFNPLIDLKLLLNWTQTDFMKCKINSGKKPNVFATAAIYTTTHYIV